MGDVPEAAAVYTFGFNSPALIYYAGRPVRATSNPADLLSEKDDIIVVAENKHGRADSSKRFFLIQERRAMKRTDYLILTRKDGE